jgi:hypothetical protein
MSYTSGLKAVPALVVYRYTFKNDLIVHTNSWQQQTYKIGRPYRSVESQQEADLIYANRPAEAEPYETYQGGDPYHLLVAWAHPPCLLSHQPTEAREQQEGLGPALPLLKVNSTLLSRSQSQVRKSCQRFLETNESC